MATAEVWMTLFSGSASPDDAKPVIVEALGELQAALDADPEAVERILAILRERLPMTPRDTAFLVADAHLGAYAGHDISYLLGWLAQPIASIGTQPATDRLAMITEMGTPGTIAALRTILGMYAKELWDTFDLWNQIPDDWRSINQNVYFDQLTGRYLIRARIQKYNGEEALIEGPPNSILGLIQLLAHSLQSVASPEAFQGELLQTFLDETEQLRKSAFPEPAKPGK